jgi:hypothetical protein
MLRGTGRWHAPARRPHLPTLADFGWQFIGFIEPYPTACYTQAEYKLTRRDGLLPGKTVVTNTATGRVWEFTTTNPGEITAAIFGPAHLLAPAEITAADYYGVA